MINRARFIHVLNDDEARLLNPLRLSPPGVVIPNGVFPDEINRVVKPGCFRTNYPVVGTRAYILFLGRLHFKKGLDYLVDAFRIVHEARPDGHLILAGSDFGYQADCQTRIDRLGLRPHVSFVGPLLGDDKLDAIRGAVCFCLPSRQEGFSIAILEALASGVPVVISDACHFPEVAEVGAGIVTPLRAEAVADALIRVLQHPTPRQTFGDAGRSLVDQRYTWPRIAEQTIGAYRGHSADPIGPVK